MKISENKLRQVIRDVIKESGMASSFGGGAIRPTAFKPSVDDRRFATSMPSKQSVQGDDVSQTDGIKLMSASTGFFQTLVDAIRFGFVTKSPRLLRHPACMPNWTMEMCSSTSYPRLFTWLMTVMAAMVRVIIIAATIFGSG